MVAGVTVKRDREVAAVQGENHPKNVEHSQKWCTSVDDYTVHANIMAKVNVMLVLLLLLIYIFTFLPR
jgi:hypothetical protein